MKKPKKISMKIIKVLLKKTSKVRSWSKTIGIFLSLVYARASH